MHGWNLRLHRAAVSPPEGSVGQQHQPRCFARLSRFEACHACSLVPTMAHDAAWQQPCGLSQTPAAAPALMRAPIARHLPPAPCHSIRKFAAKNVTLIIRLATAYAWLTTMMVIALVPMDCWASYSPPPSTEGIFILWNIAYWCALLKGRVGVHLGMPTWTWEALAHSHGMVSGLLKLTLSTVIV